MNATEERSQKIQQAWADRETARMRRAIQAAVDADAEKPAHRRTDSGLCACGYGEGKSYRSVMAHIGQMNRKG